MTISKNVSVLVVVSGVLAGATVAMSDEPNGSEEYLKQQVIAPPAQEATSSAKMSAQPKLTEKSRGVWANIDWTGDWDPDHRHWDHPSSITVYDDGTVYLYAHHLANQLPRSYYDFGATIILFTGPYQNNACLGHAVFSADYPLRGLNWGDEVWDVSVSAPPLTVISQDALRQSTCITVNRWIR
jgi:hypothetical protein